MPALDALLAALVMGLGCAVQGAVGFGANLVAAPLLALVDPAFVPGPTIVATAVLNLLVMRREGAGRVDATVHTAMAGQVVGIVGAGLLLSAITGDGLALIFAALVLVGVAFTAAGWHLARTRPNLIGIGVLSGFMGTVSGIGGPPIALVYQRADGPTLRGTLARYFTLGNLVSIPTLVMAGRLGGQEIPLIAALLPGTLVGYAASGWLATHLDNRRARPLILTLSTAAAVAVLVRALL